MRIVFYDRTPVDYTPETPLLGPLGGTESALCYLSMELAKLGHAVALVTNTSAPGRYHSVDCSNHKDAGTAALLNGADVVVSSNEALGRYLKDSLRVTKPLVIWIQHAHDQRAIKGLEAARERKAWAGYAFVSQWQFENFENLYWVPVERSRVMRNAISPRFADLTLAEPWYKTGAPPVLVYTSQPYRGLDVLLDAFPLIRKGVPGARLKVFSGFAATYRTALSDDPHAALYRRCTETDGVTYVGPIAQPLLARELAEAAALAYPSTFPETSCIAALEAMAAGASVLTTRLGALPETTAGFAEMTEVTTDRARLVDDYASMAVKALQAMLQNPMAALARREAQIAFIRDRYTWPARALEWRSWLGEIARRPVS